MNPKPMRLVPVHLVGEHVRLAPLKAAHAQGLWEAMRDTEVWTFMPTRLGSVDDVAAFIARAGVLNEQGRALAFAIHDVASGAIVGSTGFWNAEPDHRRVEIGTSWVTKSRQRSVVNTESKYLMLRHALEELGCLRVEFKTDARNARARAALLRIGAIEEGTLRCHMLLHDGRQRDSVYYSILQREWPDVRARLERLLAAPRAGAG